MGKSLLEQLSEHTVVVADTGDIQSIKQFSPQDATTNPSLITAAAQMSEYADIVSGALLSSSKAAGADASSGEIVSRAIDRLSVDFGVRILEIVPGRVSTEVDARLSFDTQATIDKGRHLIRMYEAGGTPRDRVLIKIASTWQGIRAAEVLEKEGIHCNLTLLFGLHQAVAAADAGATLISPFVGRILDYYLKKTGREGYAPHEDPGVKSVTEIYEYFKKYDKKTEIMGASFRNIDQIKELCGCDLLTIAPKLLAVLESTEAPLERKLTPEGAKSSAIEKIEMDEQTFDEMHRQDDMARVKLQEGIEGFSKALVSLEGQLLDRLSTLQR